MYSLQFTRSGKTLPCPPTQTVLEAAQAAGIDIPFSCQGGTCHTCAVKVEGKIDQEEALALTAAELAQGWALTCVGKPLSDLKVDA